jgi:hypothetical protein
LSGLNPRRPQQRVCGTGRSSGFRVILPATPSLSLFRKVASCGFRHRLQRRDRDGLTPSSLLGSFPVRKPAPVHVCLLHARRFSACRSGLCI